MTTEQWVDATGDVMTVTDEQSRKIATKAGYKPAATTTTNSRSRATVAKREVTKEEALQITDKNLSESLGMPSALAAKPDGYAFEAKVQKFITQISKRTGQEFVSTQISGTTDGQSWTVCILFNQNHEIGQTLNLVLEPSDATQSRKTISAAA